LSVWAFVAAASRARARAGGVGGLQRRLDLLVARARQPELLDHPVHRARERLRRAILQLHLDHHIRLRVRKLLRALEEQPQHVLVRARAQRLVVRAARRDPRRAHAVHRRGRRGQRPVQREHARARALFCCEVAQRGAVLREVVVPARASAHAHDVKEGGSKHLSAMTTSCVLSRPSTFFRNTGALFFALTSSDCVWPNPKRCASATATDVLPMRAR
jgi:hypothetical protein